MPSFRTYGAIASAMLAMASTARAQALSPSVEDRFRKLEQRQEEFVSHCSVARPTVASEGMPDRHTEDLRA